VASAILDSGSHIHPPEFFPLTWLNQLDPVGVGRKRFFQRRRRDLSALVRLGKVNPLTDGVFEELAALVQQRLSSLSDVPGKGRIGARGRIGTSDKRAMNLTAGYGS
jgi:hypothetical protein